MSKSEAEKDDVLLDVQHAYSKTERYIEENKKSLAIIAGAIVVLIGGYFAWTRLYLAPLEAEAQEKMFWAQQYFENDSLKKAVNGDGNHPGFKEIADEFGMTKSASLAHYYLGICYLRQGKYQESIDELKKFDTPNEVIGSVATGAMGDAYMEMGNSDEAVVHYLKAAKVNENKFTTPVYLMKAAGVYEDQKSYDNALKIYDQIRTEYGNTAEGREIDKYIARVNAAKNGM